MSSMYKLYRTLNTSTNDYAENLALLDLIRTIAVLFVVFSHLPFAKEITKSGVFHMQALGLLGVGMFFVHTCLVLMMSLERQVSQDSQMTPGSLAIKFYLRRAFRIYPLSMIVVLVLGVIYLMNDRASFSYEVLLSNLFLVQNLTGHLSVPAALWSLPYEVQMYIFLPALYLLLKGRGRFTAVTMISLWGGSVIAVLLARKLGLNYHLIKYIPAFLPGVIAYALRGSIEIRKFPPYFLICGVIFIAILFPALVAHGFKESLLLWPCCLMLGLAIPFTGELTSILVGKVASVIAKYSYGIYLVHGPMIYLVFEQVNCPVYLQYLILIVGIASLSYAAFHLIEAPGIKIGTKLAGKV